MSTERRRTKIQEAADAADLALHRAAVKVEVLRDLMPYGHADRICMHLQLMEINDTRDWVRAYMHPRDREDTQ